jgi:hypothetical protein
MNNERNELKNERMKKQNTFRHELLNPRHNVLAVGVLAQGWETGSDAPDQHLPLLLITRVQNPLHHIVGVLVFHHPLQFFMKQKKNKARHTMTSSSYAYILSLDELMKNQAMKEEE